MLEQILANGLIAGAIYALVAAGFSLIYSTNKFVHFAHGAVVAASAFFCYALFSQYGVTFWIAAPLTVIFAALLGFAINRTVYRPLRERGASSLILLVAGFAVLVFFESLLQLVFGADVKVINLLPIARGIDVLGAIITPLQIAIIAITFALLVGLFLLMKHTQLGRTLRAVASNKSVAQVRGVNPEATYDTAFLIGSAIAGVAGILVGLEQNVDPTMGSSLIIKGFAAAIIGGVGNVYGAILGALLLGIVENFGAWYLPSGYKDAVAFAVLFVFLLFKPNGILGINYGNRQRT